MEGHVFQFSFEPPRKLLSKFQPRLTHLAALLLMLLVYSGCFHKNLMTDRADDVKAIVLYEGPEGTFIISKELIFQANSKSNENGVTMISGHSELRLSSYKVESGELVGRVELGDMIEEANELLGFSEGKVWMFSINPDLGLHYRDPITLEIKESWPELSKRPALSGFKPARPDWPLINQYFVFDWNRQAVMLTDEQGFKYALDPATFALGKFEEQISTPEWTSSVYSNSGKISNDLELSLEGTPRKQIICNRLDNGPALSFLSGEWLIDWSPSKAATRLHAYIIDLDNQIQALQDSVAAMVSSDPSLAQEANWSSMSFEARELRRRMEGFNRKLEALRRDRKQSELPHKVILAQPILTGDGKSAYIHHANIIADTAHSVISRVNIAPDSTCSLAWTTNLPNVFFNASKADEAGVFSKVYSKGNPIFTYEWLGTDGKHLILVKQLQLMVLDMENGALLWQIEI